MTFQVRLDAMTVKRQPLPATEVCVILRSAPQLASTNLLSKAVKADRREIKSAPNSNRCDSMIKRLERALVLVAYIVLRHGPVYAPYIDRLERELEAARQNDPTERAKRILETYAVEDSPNAIRLDNLRSK